VTSLPRTPQTPSTAPLLSRRTIAKTAAWTAPAILLTVASPAHAASAPAGPGMILLGSGSYEALSAGTITVSGTLMPPTEGSIPADLRLSATVDGGFAVAAVPVVTGTAFTLTITAPAPASSGTVTVTSPNYPAYAQASARLTSLAPGNVVNGWSLLPLATTWGRRTGEGLDPSVSWFGPSRVMSITAAMLGVKKPWLDLRFMMELQGDQPAQNWGYAPWANLTRAPGRPTNFPITGISATVRVHSLEKNGVPQNPADAIGITIGSSTLTGSGTLGAGDKGTAPFLPNSDPYGYAISANNQVAAFLPSTLPRGSEGGVEIVFSVSSGSRTTKLGYMIYYRYP
jgi:hypothetical protein